MAGREGMSNADFARLFRREIREETAAMDTDPEEPEARTSAGLGLGYSGGARSAQSHAEPSGESTREANDAPKEAGFVRGGIGLGFTKAKDPPKDEVSAAKPVVKPRATWEKHTTGFGSKMLAKMGFSGRLGRKEDGVSAVIEVKLRPAQMGIGFGDFKEASALKHNRKLQKELRKEEGDEGEDDTDVTRGSFKEDDTLWRKRKVQSSVKKYKRAADLTQEAQTRKKKKRSDVVLDMRGPDVRVLSDVSSAYDVSKLRLEEARPKLGDELIYNVRMVVNLSEGKIYDLTQKIETNVVNVESMRKEAKIIRAQLAMDAVRVRHVRDMMEQMKKLEQIRENSLEVTSVAPILAHLELVRREFPTEFEAHKLPQLVPSLCLPPLRSLLTKANLHDNESASTVIDQFRRIQLFLLEIPEASEGKDDERPIGVFPVIREKTNEMAEDLYNYVLEEALWPVMAHYVSVQWDTKLEAGECIALFLQFRPYLSRVFEEAFLYDLVLARLKKECSLWDPRTDTTPIHDWVFPWIPLLGEALTPIYPEIRLAIGNALNQWHPKDLSVLSVLSPWRQVWGEHDYAKFTHRHIARKLIRILQRDFVIDPQSQRLEPLQWVLAWREHLPERQFVALFEGEFFPKWLKTLRKWVSGDPDLEELAKWYSGWKTFFEKNGLLTQPRFAVYFYSALVLLDAACDAFTGTSTQHRLLPELNPRAPQSYQDALIAAKKDRTSGEDGDSSDSDARKRRSSRTPLFKATSPRSVSHSVSLRDVVESLAIANNLTFMPKGLHDGQQVYAFGKHNIIIEQGVVFVEATKGTFKSVDVEQLL
jgi:tuftelin-interacting protein 11